MPFGYMYFRCYLHKHLSCCWSCMPIYSPPGLRVQVCDSLSAVTHTSAYAVSSYPTSPVFADRIAPALGHTQASFLVANAKSRIDNICLQQTNLVCNFGRQGLSAFCMILAARASAFLKRFVKFESRQTLSRRFVCRFVCNFEGLGGRSKAL